MTAERWRKIEALYQAASQLDASLRGAFLADACGDDAQLAAEVESLLRQNASALSHPAWENYPNLAEAAGGLAAGSRLGPYEIEGPLGAGGMGMVYRARDTRLNRSVAIKVLAERFGDRFEREARAIAALNHTNVCTLHDVGPNYLVMELVEGRTLADRIRQSALPLDEALDIARQIAAALEAAHERGIIHRDLKPANIRIRPDGTVKVLDFGLVKFARSAAAGADQPQSITATHEGVILGTPAYMAPEQVRGQDVDKRADIWAYGIVVYEMVTGKRPFAGDTVSDVLAAVITREPEWDQAPVRIERLLRACIEKDPKRRLRDIGDAMRLLEEPPAGVTPPGPSALRSWIPWAVAAAGILAAAGTWFLRPAQSAAPYEIQPLTSFQGMEVEPALSPDGNRLAFVWAGQPAGNLGVYVKQISGGSQPLRISPSDKDAEHPSWSPDGNRLAYVRTGANGLEILVAAALRGPERRVGTVAGAVPVSIAWSPDGRWIVAPSVGEGTTAFISPSGGSGFLRRISVDTGESRELTAAPPGANHLNPRFSPDGRRLAFLQTTGNFSNVVMAMPVGPDGAAQAKPQQVGSRRWNTYSLDWFPDNRHILVPAIRGGQLQYWKLPLDGGDSARLPLEFPVDGTPGFGRFGRGHLFQSQVSVHGARLASLVFSQLADIQRLECESATGPCHPAVFYNSSRTNEEPIASPNGQWVAFTSTQSGSRELWRARPDGSEALQLTFAPDSRPGTPRWTPDSQWLAFDAPFESDGRQAIYLVAAEGGTARRITASGYDRPGFSADGKWVYFRSQRDNFFWKMPVAGGKMQQATRSPVIEVFESADGRWLYCLANPMTRGIFRIPVEGGEEQPVYRHPAVRGWSLTAHAVYAALFAPGQPSSIVRIDIASGQSREIYRFPLSDVRFDMVPPPLSVSPDERTIYACGRKAWESDILMIDNFR